MISDADNLFGQGGQDAGRQVGERGLLTLYMANQWPPWVALTTVDIPLEVPRTEHTLTRWELIQLLTHRVTDQGNIRCLQYIGKGTWNTMETKSDFFYLYLYPSFCMNKWTHGPTYKGVPNWFVVSRKSHDGFLRTIFMKKKMICRDPSSVKYNFCGLISSINKIKCLKFYTQIENSGFLHMPCTLERRTSR